MNVAPIPIDSVELRRYVHRAASFVYQDHPVRFAVCSDHKVYYYPYYELELGRHVVFVVEVSIVHDAYEVAVTIDEKVVSLKKFEGIRSRERAVHEAIRYFHDFVE